MSIRSSHISASISSAITSTNDDDPPSPGCLHSLRVFFSLFHLYMARYRPSDFAHLRRTIWELDEEAYLQSFQQDQPENEPQSSSSRGKQHSSTGGKAAGGQLLPIGDLGYSGSTFFTTSNSRYLVKSLPRRFEHEFFTHDLFEPYAAHMAAHPESLLIRITDMAYAPFMTLGGVVGTAPTHHIVMENLLYGKEQHEAALDQDDSAAAGSSGDGGQGRKKKKWETYDLKPESYFFPERDIADGKLAPQSVKDKLIDSFPDKIRVSASERDTLLDILSRDTQLLADNKAVDYSLFLVRFPATPSSSTSSNNNEEETNPFSDQQQHLPPDVSPRGERDPWRNGVASTDGRWIYRAAVLDFFWAKHKFQPRAMTGLVKAFNFLARKGPMSITAEPGEYRERFLRMVGEICVVGG